MRQTAGEVRGIRDSLAGQAAQARYLNIYHPENTASWRRKLRLTQLKHTAGGSQRTSPAAGEDREGTGALRQT